MENGLRPLVLVPAAGGSRRFAESGIATPKALIELQIEHAVDTMLGHILCKVPNEWRVCIATTTSCFEQFEKEFEGDSTMVFHVGDSTEGQADTVCKALRGYTDVPVIIMNCDGRVEYPLGVFYEQCRNFPYGAMVTDVAGDTAYSYITDFPLFHAAYEKNPVSRWAMMGVYYFRSSYALISAIEEMKSFKRMHANGEYYLSGVYTYMAEGGPGLAVAAHRSAFRCWGTPWELARAPGVRVVDPVIREKLKEFA